MKFGTDYRDILDLGEEDKVHFVSKKVNNLTLRASQKRNFEIYDGNFVCNWLLLILIILLLLLM